MVAGALLVRVFKTAADPYVGRLTYLRVLSGTVHGQGHVWNATRGEDERIGQLLLLHGKDQEPVGEHWQIFCLLPRAKCEASPYQRDLSPTHVKRLTESIKRLERFVDPIVVISPRPGVYWTPNGNHRRTVLDKLKADFIPAILVVEPQMVFEIPGNSLGPMTTAPAPSPSRNEMVRSVGSTTSESFSAPMTSA